MHYRSLRVGPQASSGSVCVGVWPDRGAWRHSTAAPLPAPAPVAPIFFKFFCPVVEKKCLASFNSGAQLAAAPGAHCFFLEAVCLACSALVLAA